MFDDELRWRIIEMPQRVNDDQIPYSHFFLTWDDVVVAQIIGEDDTSYQIVKRLNQWEDNERERYRKDIEGLG